MTVMLDNMQTAPSNGDHGKWLVVDTDLEARWAPVDELDGSLGLDVGDGSVE